MATDFDRLSEATYQGVTFPVSDAPCEGGNDFAEHTAYRRAGADMEPTGWRAWSGSLTIPCINTEALTRRYGVLWPDKRTELLDLFRENPRGELSHPLLGNLVVAVTDVSQSGGSDVRNGVTLTVRWKEHNATLALLIGADGLPATDPVSTVVTRADAADAAGATLAGYQPVAATVDEQATYLEEAPRAFSEVAAAFSQMEALVASNLALPSVQAIGGYAATVALLNLRVALQGYKARFTPGASSVRYFVVPTTMSVAEIAVAAYGDVSLVNLLYAANAFLDPLQVGAGTVVTVLPSN